MKKYSSKKAKKGKTAFRTQRGFAAKAKRKSNKRKIQMKNV